MPSYDDEDFLNAIPENGITTSHMIADYLGCTPATANRRLKQLHDQEDVYIPRWPHHIETTPTRELEIHHPDTAIAQAHKQLDQ